MARSAGFSVYIQTHRTKRGHTTYRVRREHRGRELPAISCGTDAALARRVRDEWRVKMQRRRTGVRAVEDMSLTEWIAQDTANRARKMAPSTQRQATRAYGLLAEFLGPEAALADVDRDAIRDFISWLEGYEFAPGRRMVPNAIRIYLRALKAGLRRAMKDDRLDSDPFFGAELPAEESVAHPPSDAELAAIWTHLSHEARRAITVYLGLGLRRSELLGIDRDCILPAVTPGGARRLRVRKAKTRRGVVEYKIMAIPPQVWEAMQPIPERGPLFKVYPTTLSSSLRRAVKAAGLKRIRLHDLRHRWATRLMSATRNKYAVMQVGGWSSEAAMGRYQHETAEYVDVTLQLESVFPPIQPRIGRAKVGTKNDSSTRKSR